VITGTSGSSDAVRATAPPGRPSAAAAARNKRRVAASAKDLRPGGRVERIDGSLFHPSLRNGETLITFPALISAMRSQAILGVLLAVAVAGLFVWQPSSTAAPSRGAVRLATQLEETPLQVRPPFIAYTGDGTGYLAGRKDNPRRVEGGSGGSGLRWLSWGPRTALAHGWDWLNNCRPDCARGSFHRFPAIVRARRPRHGVFTRMTIKTKIRGRWVYDHRILQYSPPTTIGGERFPAFWEWGICGSPYTRHC
jgi:hypothetical protein